MVQSPWPKGDITAHCLYCKWRKTIKNLNMLYSSPMHTCNLNIYILCMSMDLMQGCKGVKHMACKLDSAHWAAVTSQQDYQHSWKEELAAEWQLSAATWVRIDAAPVALWLFHQLPIPLPCLPSHWLWDTGAGDAVAVTASVYLSLNSDQGSKWTWHP